MSRADAREHPYAPRGTPRAALEPAPPAPGRSRRRPPPAPPDPPPADPLRPRGPTRYLRQATTARQAIVAVSVRCAGMASYPAFSSPPYSAAPTAPASPSAHQPFTVHAWVERDHAARHGRRSPPYHAPSNTGSQPPEVTTDQAPTYPRVIDELIPAARHVSEQYANNPRANTPKILVCFPSTPQTPVDSFSARLQVIRRPDREHLGEDLAVWASIGDRVTGAGT